MDHLTDVLDRATHLEEMERANCLRNFRKPEAPAATGRCLYCDDDVPEGHRWCSANHRDLWEKENRR